MFDLNFVSAVKYVTRISDGQGSSQKNKIPLTLNHSRNGNRQASAMTKPTMRSGGCQPLGSYEISFLPSLYLYLSFLVFFPTFHPSLIFLSFFQPSIHPSFLPPFFYPSFLLFGLLPVFFLSPSIRTYIHPLVLPSLIHHSSIQPSSIPLSFFLKSIILLLTHSSISVCSLFYQSIHHCSIHPYSASIHHPSNRLIPSISYLCIHPSTLPSLAHPSISQSIHSSAHLYLIPLSFPCFLVSFSPLPTPPSYDPL